MKKGLLKWERRAREGEQGCRRHVEAREEGKSRKRVQRAGGGRGKGQSREEERAMEGRQGGLQQGNTAVGVFHMASWMFSEG